jgi:hypothetical protein
VCLGDEMENRIECAGIQKRITNHSFQFTLSRWRQPEFCA